MVVTAGKITQKNPPSGSHFPTQQMYQLHHHSLCSVAEVEHRIAPSRVGWCSQKRSLRHRRCLPQQTGFSLLNYRYGFPDRTTRERQQKAQKRPPRDIHVCQGKGQKKVTIWTVQLHVTVPNLYLQIPHIFIWKVILKNTTTRGTFRGLFPGTTFTLPNSSLAWQ